MRTVEWIYLIFNLLMFVGGIGIGRQSQHFREMVWSGFAISGVLLTIHGVVEGLRWPMIPAYLLTLVPLVVLFTKARRQQQSGVTLLNSKRSGVSTSTSPVAGKFGHVRIIATSLLVLVYAVVSIGLPLLFPVFSFAKPAGPYGIGTVSYDWTDSSREEIMTRTAGDQRELMVQIWYPTNPDVEGAAAPYVNKPEIYGTAFNEVLKLPKLLFSSLSQVKTHAIQEAQLSDAEAKYPVVLFSHGLHGYENQNTFQVEQLVSQGYIVVGINHTYNSLVSVFPDGRVAQFESEGKEGFEQLQFSYMDKLNETWVQDAQFVLDEVEKLGAEDPSGRFTGRMDLDNIGMFGHSFGGATTVQMLMDDPRVKAGMNMDGVLFGEKRIPAEGVGKPFLMMSADSTVAGTSVMSDKEIAAMGTTRPEAEKYYEEVYERYEPVTAGGNYWMELTNTKHLSFSDLYLISPLLERTQGVDARGTQRLVNDTTIDFFNHYLKGQPLHMDTEVGEHESYLLKKG
ncbi:acetylhydrolase [Paenibacillus sp. FSL R5-0766]|uniref:alpha/beta hydrolase family protein n=1 Tax=unclassified Paenibacillus TaxID=185978 RepID=UPI00096BD205|nr:acetylhydrolase [Paenibacillus sp. FSL R5-0765]OMF61603.1 acetylhydrolase [Paenibacillus sp. FSL R5-0765]